ncbi:hypothetical protein HYFRA_00001822 [Hymenoscyphus fraxineus]|uniref:GPI inositol-deacylase n=1 Tax=Hymenoscyphus fraxineus TaxID=746836 RepID=A0A9N9KKQ6_9HELO|nr:hypothetical protein HYFRA_00001822 [Hymenoscyphus fraxineus]
MPCTKETVKSAGLNIWSSDPEAGVVVDVDIIAVQGLGAHPFYTWAKKAQTTNPISPKRSRLDFLKIRRGKDKAPHGAQEDVLNEFMWPRDLLVPIFKNARIATYSYKSDWLDRTIKTSLDQCAEQFLNILYQNRQKPGENQRPIVLIGHSLGGLLVQQALVSATLDPYFSEISNSVAGIIFLGTPFQGSDAAVYGNLIARFTGLDATLLKMLQRENPELHKLSRQFWSSYSHVDIVCFYESRVPESKLWKRKLVSTQSASLHGKRMIFLDTDHSGLNKFSGIEDENFALLLPELRRMVDTQMSVLHKNNSTQAGQSSKPSENTHWNVPRQVNGLFTGRDDILDKIRHALDPTHSVGKQKRFVITALGGQGKSEICLKVAENMRESFWGVFWVGVDNLSTARNGFLSIARALEKPAESVEDVCNILANTKQTWLLILDNADNPEFDYQIYFPSGNYGSVIMTSRNPYCGRQYNNVGWEMLDSLDDKHAATLLLKAARIPEDEWATCQQAAANVIECLGSHTLALIQAGAYISKDHKRLDQYPAIFQRQRKRLLVSRPNQANSRYGDVYATFEASAEVLKNSEEEAAQDALRLLSVISMLHFGSLDLVCFEYAWEGAINASSKPDDDSNIDDVSSWHVSMLPGFIPVGDSEWDDCRLIEAVSTLESFSLVFRNEIEGILPAISMHPLAHAWAKDRQEPSEQYQAWITTGCILALYLSCASPESWYERYFRPHLQSFLNITSMPVKRAFSLGPTNAVLAMYLECGWALENMRDDYRLDQLLKDIIFELKLDADKPTKEFIPLFKLRIDCLYNLSSYEEAVSLGQKVLKSVEDHLNENDPEILSLQHRLASAYIHSNQLPNSISLLEKIVLIESTTLDKGDSERLASQHALASAYLKNNQILEAISLLEKVVRIQQNTLTEDHPKRLVSEHELASAYLKNNKILEAISLLEKVVRIEQNTVTKDHPKRLASEHGLAKAYLANNQTLEAITLLETVVQIKQNTLTEDHPKRLVSEHELARAYLKNNQILEAISLLEKVVQIKQNTLTEDHPDRLASEHELASAYLKNNQILEAISLLKRVVQIEKRILPEDHPDRLQSEEALATAYYHNGQLEKALELMTHVVQIRATTLREDDPARLRSVRWLEGMEREFEEAAED